MRGAGSRDNRTLSERAVSFADSANSDCSRAGSRAARHGRHSDRMAGRRASAASARASGRSASHRLSRATIARRCDPTSRLEPGAACVLTRRSASRGTVWRHPPARSAEPRRPEAACRLLRRGGGRACTGSGRRRCRRRLRLRRSTGRSAGLHGGRARGRRHDRAGLAPAHEIARHESQEEPGNERHRDRKNSRARTLGSVTRVRRGKCRLRRPRTAWAPALRG